MPDWLYVCTILGFICDVYGRVCLCNADLVSYKKIGKHFTDYGQSMLGIKFWMKKDPSVTSPLSLATRKSTSKLKTLYKTNQALYKTKYMP